MKLSDAINRFKKYTRLTKSEGTVRYYNFYLGCLEESLGDYECDDIDQDVILDYIQSRKVLNPEIKRISLNKHITTIKTVVKYATGRKIEFSKLKEDKKVIPTVSPKTYKTIFKYYEKRLYRKYAFRNYLFFRILLDTGLRLSEITHLKVENIDSNDALIYVDKTKTGIDRYVVITKETKMLLTKFILTHDIKKYIFTDFKHDKPLSTSSVECFTYRLKKKLNLKENITPHKWRHTFATKYLRAGGNLETLRLILGHTNLKTTQKYLHLDKGDLLKEYNSIM